MIKREWMEPCAWGELERVDQGYMARHVGHFFIKGKERGKRIGKSFERCFWGGTGRWGTSEQRGSPSSVSWGDWGTQGQLWDLNVWRKIVPLLGEAIRSEEVENKICDEWWGLHWSWTIGLWNESACVSFQEFLWLSRNQHPIPGLGNMGVPRTLLLFLLSPGKAEKSVNSGQVESIIKMGDQLFFPCTKGKKQGL